MKSKLFVALASVLLSMGSMAQTSDPMVVSTKSGPVQGILQEGTSAFLGIPYAEVERFMPPKPVKAWKEVRMCDHWGGQIVR